MSDTAERLYNVSPIFLQNIAISLYGMKLRRLRYGGQHPAFRRQLAASQKLTVAALRELQNASLQRLFASARRHVPYYAATADYAGIDAQTLTVESLPDRLPVLPKAVVRGDAKVFHSDAYPRGQLLSIHTSGTTGTPLDIRVTPAAVQKNYAFFARMLDWYGVAPVRDRSVTFAGRLIVPQQQQRPPYWRYNRFMNNLLMSSYRLSDENMLSYLEALERFGPQFIDAYPSAIYSIAAFAMRQNIPIKARPRVIVTSSETVMPHQRAAVESAFGTALRDHYGCAEMAALIAQCEHGRYHVNPEYGIVEILRADGTPCAMGEVGELCCTGLVNDAMPLIRYKLGDSAAFGPDGCECGRAFPVIEALVGRTDDILRTPDGREIGRLDPIFKSLTGIVEAQIVQVTLTEIEILVVPEGEFDTVAQETLRNSILKRLSPDMTVAVRVVESIPRTASGKFRSVVSRLQRH